MSMDFGSERVCYVHCNYCNTILVVNVPCNNMFTIVTVRCGHCASTITVNMGALFQSAPLQHLQHPVQKQHSFDGITTANKDSSSSSNSKSNNNSFAAYNDQASDTNEHHRISPIRPPEKRQRVPSAYNRFIKEEIQRIKANNPDITHREAFSSAAKNWAHFPHIHFGTKQSN